MMPRIEAKSLQDASTLICKTLAHCATVEVWIPAEHTGYWATLKLNPKPVADMTVAELKRDLRRMDRPQPYDVQIIPWDGFMYRGYHQHKPSSAF